MTEQQIRQSIAYCGLLCGLCQPEETCRCHGNNHCGKRLSPHGCYQYNCCTEKGFSGCWECPLVPCGKDMLSQDHIKIRAFLTCIREDGLDRFSQYILRNLKNGIRYHTHGVRGDYDLATEADVLALSRAGRP